MSPSERAACLSFALPQPLSNVSHALMRDALGELFEQINDESACRQYAHWFDADDYPGWVEAAPAAAAAPAEASDTEVLRDYLRGA